MSEPTQTAEQSKRHPVTDTKTWRMLLDNVLQDVKLQSLGKSLDPGGRGSRERSLAITKLQEAIMWLGMDLKAMKEEGLSEEPNPYPSSYDPSNKVIEPTAQGLRL